MDFKRKQGLKTRELMINDRVVAFGDVAKVVRAEDDGLIYVECKDYVRKAILVVDMGPVQLTEDILLKNGFVLRAGYLDGNEYILPGEDLYIFYEKEIKKMSVELGPRDIDILYVHQFQHLLRMCGLDELADNIKI